MRICILTQPLHSNYGGLLQAYAMQRVLRSMGHEVWTEDRQPNRFSSLRLLLRSPFVRGIFGMPRYLTQSEVATIREYTNRFIEENITTTEPIYGSDKRSLEKYNFEAYIVGSDQVWRKDYSCGIENYFLDFAPDNTLKIAYAASFGVSTWEFSASLSRKLKALAQRFDFIGVREADAVDICRESLGVMAHHVLDPTMLLEVEEYQNLMEQDMGYAFGGGGVASYLLDPTPVRTAAIEKIAQSLSLTVNSLGHSMRDNLYDGVPAEQRVVPPVAAWLSGIYNSQFLVTDSFHGVLFAIIFNKQFVVYLNSERGASRFRSLLALFSLEDRVLDDNNSLEQLSLKVIDFEAVNAKLKEQRAECLELLFGALRSRK